ncbi:MAG: dCTP deaminase domain-containing protein, partial [Acidimicrobiaceae bacterium]
MILSDRSIKEALEAKRIIIDPLDMSCIQPSSIDVKVSNLFRVF